MTVAHRLFARSLSNLLFTELDDYHSDVLTVGKEVAVAYVIITCRLSPRRTEETIHNTHAEN